MANNNFEFNFFSDDWGDQSYYTWSEQSGRKYLLEVTKETKKFYELYIKLRHISNHLDFIFATMQWKQLENKIKIARDSFSDDVHINTFHGNPLNIAFTSIFAFIDSIFEVLIKSEYPFSTLNYFRLYRLVNKASLNQQQGVYSIDSGDFILATCHFKNVIATVNDLIRELSTLNASKDSQDKEKSLENFLKDMKIAMFDIRELSWQAISFCNTMAEN